MLVQRLKNYDVIFLILSIYKSSSEQDTPETMTDVLMTLNLRQTSGLSTA